MKPISFLRLAILTLLVIASTASAQKINPNNGINWPQATGMGAPTASCTSANFEQPYLDISTVPNTQYHCGTNGWFISSGSGTPGAPVNSIQVNVNNALGGFAGFTYTNAAGLLVPNVLIANRPQEMWSATAFGSLAAIFANPTYQAATQSSVLIEPTFTEDNELDAASGDRRSFLDLRQGYFHFKSINPGPYHQFANSNIIFDCSNSDSPTTPQGSPSVTSTANCMTTTYSIDLPGFYNGSVVSPADYQINTNSVGVNVLSAAINKSLETMQIFNQGAGDIGVSAWNSFNGYGGQDHVGDEGYHFRIDSSDIGSEFVATVASSTDVPASGFAQLVLNLTSGSNLGVMRLLMDTTQATTDNIISLALVGDGTTTATMTNTTYPISSVATLVSSISAIPNNTLQAKASQTFTISTSVDLSTLGLVKFQFAGTPSPESSTVTSWGAFNSGASTQTVTAMLSEQHNANNKIYFGGTAGEGLTYDADTAAAGGIKSTFYVFGSTANNKLVIGRYLGGNPNAGFTHGGAVHVYPIARVLDVRGPAGDDTAVRVERSGVTWNVSDTVEAGLIATSRNDTYFYHLADNSPYSEGATYTYNLGGSAAGSIGPRDFMLVINDTPESAYTWNPGTPGEFTIGNWFHWIGQIGGVFNIEQPLHGSFLQEFNCGFTLVDDGNAKINNVCSGSGGEIGWNIIGDTQFIGGIGGLRIASFSEVNGANFTRAVTMEAGLGGGPGGVSLTVNQSPGGASDAFDVFGASTFNGNVEVIGALTMAGTNTLFTNSINMQGNHDCSAGFSHTGDLGCNTASVTAPSFTGGIFNAVNTSTGAVAGSLSNNGGALALGAGNCPGAGGFCGFIQLTAPLGILATTPEFQIVSGLLDGGTPGLTIRGNSTNGNTGSPLNLEVSGFTTNSTQRLLHTQGVTVSGGLAELDLTPNGGLTTFGGMVKHMQYIVATLPTTSSVPAAGNGDMAVVTDATAFTPGSAPTGGGSTPVPVIFNSGTNAWIMY